MTKQKWAVYRLVFTLLIFATLLSIVGGKYIRPAELEWQVMASENDLQSQKIHIMNDAELDFRELVERRKELELKLKAATASAKAQQLTPAEAKDMIRLTFPPELRRRFEQITMQCENGQLKTDAVNYNNDKAKSKDVGMAQINSRWHSARVEKMFGMEFETAMEIPILNYIYAAFMVDHADNFEAWVCDDLV